MKKYIYGLTVVMSSIFLAPVGAQEEEEGQESLSPGEEAPEAMSPSGESTKISAPAAATWRDEKSGNLYANSSVQFTLAATDNLSMVDYIEYRIDSGEYARYTSPIVLTSEGAHSLSYRAIDRAGNREFDRNFNVIVDSTPPKVNIFPTQSFVMGDGRVYSSQGNTFTFRAVDKYSGVRNISYAVNDDSEQPYQQGREIQLTQPGRQLIRYKAIDNVGNTTEEKTLFVSVDNSRPVVGIYPNQPLVKVNGASYSRRTTGFDVRANDEGSGVERILVRIDGSQEWQTYIDTIYFGSENRHSIEAKAIDAVGNESELVSLGFIIDDNPPMTDIKTSVSAEPAAGEPAAEAEEESAQ